MKPFLRKPEPERDEKGIPFLTTKFIKELCYYMQSGLYETPYLNEKLYLHFLGLHRISGLEDYPNIVTLFLENNGLLSIDNLACMPKIRFLYLQDNAIKKIENIEMLSELRTLNLANNYIKKIEGLESLTNLSSLDLSNNLLEKFEDYQDVVKTPSIVSLSLRNNKIEADENIIGLLAQMPNLECLYLKDNPAAREMSFLRKKITGNLPKLGFYDERPVTTDERRLSQAWLIGGKEAEADMRMRIAHDNQLKHKALLNAVRKMEEIGRRERLMREQEGEEELIRRTEELKIEKKREREEEERRKQREELGDEEEEEKTEENEEAEGLGQGTREEETPNEEGNTSNEIMKESEEERKSERSFAKTEEISLSINQNERQESGSETPSALVEFSEDEDDPIWTRELKERLQAILESVEFNFSEATKRINAILEDDGDVPPFTESELRLKYKEMEMKLRNQRNLRPSAYQVSLTTPQSQANHGANTPVSSGTTQSGNHLEELD